ncbi:MAG: hypothetical protein J6L91_02340 [Clostridia bacterium]|nr:hypothetical protein [Clostridia bacterium]
MKNKFNLTASIFQIIFGVLAILSYIVLASSGENMIKWTVTLILSIAFVVLGIIGILDYKSNK